MSASPGATGLLWLWATVADLGPAVNQSTQPRLLVLLGQVMPVRKPTLS